MTFDEGSLDGRVILVAGGSGGLGAATSTWLARDGARVVIGYRRNRERAQQLQDSISQRFNRSVTLVNGDIGEPESRRRYLDAATALGPLYGLVCLSGDPARVNFEEAEREHLAASMEKNYYGPLLLARDAARLMRENGDGAIVFFSTMQATAVFEGSYNYAGPKVALTQAALIMARQWGGPGGVRVNVVAPGVNQAGMALDSIKSGKYDFFVNDGIIPRFGKPSDTARVVRLLMQPDNYLTGQVITVDGGLTLRR